MIDDRVEDPPEPHVLVHFSFELSRSEERTRVLAEEIALLRARMDDQDPPTDRTPTAPVDEAPED